MDNSSSPPPSYSPAAEEPCSPLVTIVASIPPTIARPMFAARPYEFHGLLFNMLPPDVQSFLSSHGLDNAAQYDPAAVATVRLWLTDQLLDTVNPVCEAIVYINVRYNLLLTQHSPCHPELLELVRIVSHELLPQLEQHMLRYLANADALVWADVAARECVSLEDACWYRWLQTQPAIELVDMRLADLYEWVAGMWMKGWRSNGYTTYVVPESVSPDLESVSAAAVETPAATTPAPSLPGSPVPPYATSVAPASAAPASAAPASAAPASAAAETPVAPPALPLPDSPVPPYASPPRAAATYTLTPPERTNTPPSRGSSPQTLRNIIFRVASASPPTTPSRTASVSPPVAKYEFASTSLGRAFPLRTR
ncbi:hypothetical protein DFH06DRAFT_1197855 [Mycena polygramma]|nr:hypothetical protein DFH06DRAFT_1197855 [Mycena polygramma]